MTMDTLMESLPAYAKDLKLNYSSLVRNNTELTPTQLWGTVVAAAMATRNAALTSAAVDEASKHIDSTALDAAKSAAAIMGMNNIFYRFHHLSSNDKYATLPSRLRMNVIRSHGTDPVDFELWSLAVSAINGCGKCVDSHEKVVREKGITEEVVAAVIRVTSVIHALGPVLEEAAAVGEPTLVTV